ncbi:hypothetical protein BDY21DRAFT_365756 [Lineolata rhizophorae]|uniref:Uncharacterized protein n=1 Tax=Lineolata rhizophorae TaxID=578093 RepID=A0A6A6NUA7_9PEZI|nr:hypothetical protein BDY21DRAFT_365756 [Lineolata rhizophorae]
MAITNDVATLKRNLERDLDRIEIAEMECKQELRRQERKTLETLEQLTARKHVTLKTLLAILPETSPVAATPDPAQLILPLFRDSAPQADGTRRSSGRALRGQPRIDAVAAAEPSPTDLQMPAVPTAPGANLEGMPLAQPNPYIDVDDSDLANWEGVYSSPTATYLIMCPMICRRPDGIWVELCCHKCGCNSNSANEADGFKGPMGLIRHLQRVHKISSSTGQGVKLPEVYHLCGVREIPTEEIKAFLRGLTNLAIEVRYMSNDDGPSSEAGSDGFDYAQHPMEDHGMAEVAEGAEEPVTRPLPPAPVEVPQPQPQSTQTEQQQAGGNTGTVPASRRNGEYLETCPTIVRNPSTGQWVELRCPVCKGNCHPTKFQYFKGLHGLSTHVKRSHNEFYQQKSRQHGGWNINHCIHRVLTNNQADEIASGAVTVETIKSEQSQHGNEASSFLEHSQEPSPALGTSLESKTALTVSTPQAQDTKPPKSKPSTRHGNLKVATNGAESSDPNVTGHSAPAKSHAQESRQASGFTRKASSADPGMSEIPPAGSANGLNAPTYTAPLGITTQESPPVAHADTTRGSTPRNTRHKQSNAGATNGNHNVASTPDEDLRERTPESDISEHARATRGRKLDFKALSGNQKRKPSDTEATAPKRFCRRRK